jgi:uncharacterized protein
VSTTSPVGTDGLGLEKLQLADWRRCVAELYAEVRRLAVADPAAAHARWRSVRESLYREHPASPVMPERRSEFRAGHFPYDPAMRFQLRLLADEPAASTAPAPWDGPAAGSSPPSITGLELGLRLPMSVGQPLGFDRIGWLEVPFQAGSRRLAVYWLAEYSGGLFVPFRDATNGHETYGGGRYLLDTGKGADLGGDPAGTIVIDFNFAYQPSCAFDPRWSCSLAPPENRLDVEVRAGERIA